MLRGSRVTVDKYLGSVFKPSFFPSVILGDYESSINFSIYRMVLTEMVLTSKALVQDWSKMEHMKFSCYYLEQHMHSVTVTYYCTLSVYPIDV